MADVIKLNSSGWVPDSVRRDQELLSLRRRGLSFDQIAEEMGYADRFAVIDALSALYKRMRPINVEEIKTKISGQIDDLVTAYHQAAHDGDLKSAAFVLKALELQAKLHGAITPPSVNVQVNNEKPWQGVYRTILSEGNDDGIIEGHIVPAIDGNSEVDSE